MLAFEIFRAHPNGSAALKGLVTPRFKDSESVLLAAGILGATVMPHVIYLHSSLTQRRVIGANAGERKRIFRFEQIDVIIAMTIAGLVNMAMLIMAAGIFHSRGLTQVSGIDDAYRGRLAEAVYPGNRQAAVQRRGRALAAHVSESDHGLAV